MKQLTESEFDAIKFVDNHLDDNASWDGAMFETYGDELQFVLAQPNDRICTILEADSWNGSPLLLVTSGYHLVNRLGYLVAAAPVNEFEYIDDWE